LSGDTRRRDVQPDDRPIVFEQQLDAAATRMADFPSRDRTVFDAHRASNILGNPTALTQTVLLDGNVAGYIGSRQQDSVRLVGYWIGREYRGVGVATAALARFLRLVTARPLHAHVASHHLASIRVLEKCGIRLEREEEARPRGEESGELVLVLSQGRAARGQRFPLRVSLPVSLSPRLRQV
jgi:RimJ/RimL family protein N-acetyltransferase